MKQKTKSVIFILLILFTFLPVLRGNLYADEYSGEKIVYTVKPVGHSEYMDLGIIDFHGKKVRLATFYTKVLWFEDIEKIYAQPDTLLPVRIERDITTLTGKEFIVEEYDQKKFIMTITKFKGKKKVSTMQVKGDGPIHNAILVAFYPRLQPKLAVGWHFQIRVPAKFDLTLVSAGAISIPAGKFKAYYFSSRPDRFEFWVNQDKPRIPIKIKGKGAIKYELLMKEYIPGHSK